MKSEKVKIDKPLSKLMEIRHSGTYSLFTFTYSLNRQVSKGKSGEWGNSEERRVKSENRQASFETYGNTPQRHLFTIHFYLFPESASFERKEQRVSEE